MNVLTVPVVRLRASQLDLIVKAIVQSQVGEWHCLGGAAEYVLTETVV